MNAKRNPWLWIPSLYLAEGMPNAIVVTVAVVMLKNMGIDNVHVGIYTSLLYLPWVIKPFWAPFVDIFSTKRKWIVAMQLAISAALILSALTLPTTWWLPMLLVAFWSMAFFSATHDIAADGFYMLALNDRQQAFFVGIRSTFYRLANLLASGGLVWVAGKLIESGRAADSAWQMVLTGVSAFFMLCAVWHISILPKPAVDRPNKAKTAQEILGDFGRAFVTFFQRPNVVVALLFILFYRLPEAFLTKMVQPFLLDPATAGGLGLSTANVGVVNGTYGVIGIVLGGIIGGIYIARFGLRRSLWPMALMLTLPSAFYCYLAAALPQSMLLISIGIAIEQFGYGFGFTAYMVYMMRFCEGSSYTTSHYAFCTGIMALGLLLPGMLSGVLQESLGYFSFFTIVMALCPITFLVTELVRRTLR